MRPGAGKTAIMARALSELVAFGDISGALVVAPKKVAQFTWPEELQKFSPELRCVFLPETTDTDDIGASVVSVARKADIYVINAESFHRLFGSKILVHPNGIPLVRGEDPDENTKVRWHQGPWVRWKHRPNMLVIDESSKLKNPRGQRNQTLRHYIHHFPRRVIMTGSPTPNHISDIFGQMLLLDDGATLGRELKAFRTRYMEPYQVKVGEHEFRRWRAKKGAEEFLAGRLSHIATVLDPKDYINFPKRIGTVRPVRLPPAVLAAYKRAVKDGSMRIDDAAVRMGGGAAAKRRQFASGTMYTPDGVKQLHTAKYDELVTLLDELGGPALIAYEFDCEGEYLQSKLGCPRICGGTKGVGELIDAWNRREIDRLLVQPKGVSHGLNMQYGGSSVIFYTSPWDWDDVDQLICRLERQGQPDEHVFAYFLAAAGTTDEAVAKVLASKEASQAALFAALKEEAKRES